MALFKVFCAGLNARQWDEKLCPWQSMNGRNNVDRRVEYQMQISKAVEDTSKVVEEQLFRQIIRTKQQVHWKVYIEFGEAVGSGSLEI